MDGYKSIIKKHPPTGVLFHFYMLPTASEKDIEYMTNYGGEPNHIILQGRIAKDKKHRRKGIWQQDKDDSKQIFFTCPWCCKIGTSESFRVGRTADSVWCKHCLRHLTLSYRKQGREQEGF